MPKNAACRRSSVPAFVQIVAGRCPHGQVASGGAAAKAKTPRRCRRGADGNGGSVISRHPARGRAIANLRAAWLRRRGRHNVARGGLNKVLARLIVLRTRHRHGRGSNRVPGRCQPQLLAGDKWHLGPHVWARTIAVGQPTGVIARLIAIRSRGWRGIIVRRPSRTGRRRHRRIKIAVSNPGSPLIARSR